MASWCHVLQVMLHELLAKTWGRSGFECFIKRLQAQYAGQAAVAQEAAEQQLAGLAEWQPARAGMFMWFRLTGELVYRCLALSTCCGLVQHRL
jgi:DNA-binding transcriptional MocR family regulator